MNPTPAAPRIAGTSGIVAPVANAIVMITPPAPDTPVAATWMGAAADTWHVRLLSATEDSGEPRQVGRRQRGRARPARRADHPPQREAAPGAEVEQAREQHRADALAEQELGEGRAGPEQRRRDERERDTRLWWSVVVAL